MNILVTNVPAVYRIDLYERLGKSGWKIFFYARNASELEYCSDNRTLSFPFEDVTLPFIFLRMVLLQPEVVVCINASPITLLCGIYSWLFRKRFVIWWAGTDLSERHAGLLKRIFRRFVFRLADAFIAYSEHAGSYLSKMGVSNQKVTVLGNMTFDPAGFRSRVDHERAKRTSHPPTLLSVANLIERKNHIFLLRVFAELRKKFPELRLVIAGEGPERQRLEHMIREMDLKGVELRGHVHRDEMPALFAEADVFVHPATMDQWPQSLNEAMSAGVPVVVSPQSGVSQTLLISGKDLLLPQLTINSFVNSVSILLMDSEFKARIILAAKLKVADLFCISVKQILNIGNTHNLTEPSQESM
ncbi:MAG: glycosyltransferase family 4 protein [Sulfurimonas sp.]|nr:glycosyltransferase family 4 protein [Sulfurimonas sp.]